MAKRKKAPAKRKASPPPKLKNMNSDSKSVLLLSATELQEFLQKRGAVQQAQITSQLIVAGYEVWANELRKRYGIKGKFEVDARTGQVHIIENPNG